MLCVFHSAFIDSTRIILLIFQKYQWTVFLTVILPTILLYTILLLLLLFNKLLFKSAVFDV